MTRPAALLAPILALALALASALTPGPALAEERAVALDVPGAHLAGTLLRPDDAAGGRAVLILPGSGAVDRDGNAPGLETEAYRQLAERLGDCGVASLRVDKRGVGASRAGDPEAAPRFEDRVSDAEAWLGFLRAQPGLDAIYLLGHSQGGLVAALAAEDEALAGLILLASAGRPLGALLEAQLDAAGLSPALRARAQAILESLRQGRRVDDVPKELSSLFRPSVQGFLIDWLKLDPKAVLAASDEPALVVQGTNDLQVTPDDAERLAGARPGVRLVLVKGMNHVLKEAPEGRAANLASYDDPDLPLAPELVEAIQRFVGCRE